MKTPDTLLLEPGSTGRLQQTPHDHHRKRYRSHPSDFTREENVRVRCLTGGAVDVLESDV